MLMVQVGNTKSATGLLKVAKRQHVTRRPTADEWEETALRFTFQDTTTNNHLHLHLQLQRL